MERKKTRNFVSALVITAMVASIFALPVLSGDNDVNAAAKKKKKKTIRVTYKANGGTFSAKKYAKKKSYVKKYAKGSKIGKLPKVTKKGYSLKGWYTKKSKGKRIKTKTKVSKNMKAIALWKAKTYTVRFDSQGGSAVSNIKVKYDSNYGQLPTPTRDYYDFQGWYTSALGGTKITADSIYKTDKGTTLYAKWEYSPVKENYLKALKKSPSQVEAILGVTLAKANEGKYTVFVNQNSDNNSYVFDENNQCVFMRFPGNDILKMEESKLNRSALPLKDTFLMSSLIAPEMKAKIESQDTLDIIKIKLLSYQIKDYYLIEEVITQDGNDTSGSFSLSTMIFSQLNELLKTEPSQAIPVE